MDLVKNNITRIILILFIIIICFLVFYDDRIKLSEFSRSGKNDTLYYYIESNPAFPEFRNQASDIIQKSGWNKLYNLQLTDDINKAYITISLVPTETLAMYRDENDNNFDSDGRRLNYSITAQSRSTKPIILIDADNWKFGVKRSGLSLDQYREYVITHEFGHALGYDHQKCDENTIGTDGRCPVMNQSTRGCKEFPCGYQVNTDKDTEIRINESYFR
jgi:hypothetical protein